MWTVDVLNSVFSFWVKPIIIFSFLGLYVRARVDKSSSTCHWILSMFGLLGICILIVGWFLPVTLNLAIVPHGFVSWLNVNIYMYIQNSGMSFLMWIFGVYIFITLFLINLRLYDLYTTWRLVNYAVKLNNPDIYHMLCVIKEKMYIKKIIPIYVSDSSTTPMVWGVFRPRIVLPANYVTWDKDRAKRILAHELAHVKRNDWIVKQLIFVFTCFFWFVPGVRTWQKRIDWYAELACDDAVIRAYDCRAEYATDLMALGTSMRLNQALLGFAEAQTLAARIRYVLESGRERDPLTGLFKFGMCFIFMVLFTLFSVIRFSSMSWFYNDEFIINYPTVIHKETDDKEAGKKKINSKKIKSNEDVQAIKNISSLFSTTVQQPRLDKKNNREEILQVVAHKKLTEIDGGNLSAIQLPLIKTPEISMSGYVGQHLVAPIYPHNALSHDIEGKVVALFDIDENGRVQNIRITHAYPKRIFNNAVIAALQKSIYEPTRIYDYAITTKNVKEIFVFNIHYTTHITND